MFEARQSREPGFRLTLFKKESCAVAKSMYSINSHEFLELYCTRSQMLMRGSQGLVNNVFLEVSLLRAHLLVVSRFFDSRKKKKS